MTGLEHHYPADVRLWRSHQTRIEHAKLSAGTLDEADVEKPIDRNNQNHVLAGILGVLTGVLLIAAVAAILR